MNIKSTSTDALRQSEIINISLKGGFELLTLFGFSEFLWFYFSKMDFLGPDHSNILFFSPK